MKHGSQGQVPFNERVNQSVICYINKNVKGPGGFNDKKVFVNLEFQWSVGDQKRDISE